LTPDEIRAAPDLKTVWLKERISEKRRWARDGPIVDSEKRIPASKALVLVEEHDLHFITVCYFREGSDASAFGPQKYEGEPPLTTEYCGTE
jgi:hypothetical protein